MVWLSGVSVPHIFSKLQSERGSDVLKLHHLQPEASADTMVGKEKNQAEGPYKLLEYPYLGPIGKN